MKVTAAVAALAAGAIAAPSGDAPTPVKKVASRASGCASAVTLDASTNVWKKYKLHANTYYRDEVNKAVDSITDSSLKTSAAKVADVGSFLWMYVHPYFTQSCWFKRGWKGDKGQSNCSSTTSTEPVTNSMASVTPSPTLPRWSLPLPTPPARTS